MNLEDFIKNFAEQFEETDISEFKPETVFKDLEEWSSLTALTIIAMADEKYKIKLSGAEIRSANNLTDLYEIVKAKVV